MGWFEKKGLDKTKSSASAEFPDLPKLPELPELPENNKEFGSMAAIKQGISFPQLNPLLPKATSQISNAPAITPITKEIRNFDEMPARVTSELGSPPKVFSKETEPIFVKLERFRDAAENFEGIKERVAGIEKMLKEVMELKEKEEAEIKEWEHEIQMMKVRIENIDNSLFKKN